MPKPAPVRREPRQQRAQVTVDAILTAAAHILKKGGYPAFNTNEVARVAGVSIGSLYQYFPSKQALLSELDRRHALEVATPIFAALEGSKGRPIRDVLHEIVAASIQAHSIEPELHRVLSDQLPKLEVQPWEIEMGAHAKKLVKNFLRCHAQAIGPRHTTVATFLLTHIVESAVHAAVWEIPSELGSGALGKELEILLYAYLSAGDLKA